MSQEQRGTPAEQQKLGGGGIEELLRLDDNSSLPGYSTGLQAAYAFTDAGWKARATRIVLTLAATGQPFTIQAIRKTGLPEPDKQQRWGALMAGLRHAGLIELVGAEMVTSSDGTAKPVRLWAGTPRARRGLDLSKQASEPRPIYAPERRGTDDLG